MVNRRLELSSSIRTFSILRNLNYIPATIVRAVVLSQLWFWFICPTFDLPELPIIVAVGILLIINLLTQARPAREITFENETIITIIADMTVSYTVSIFAGVVGFLLHYFFM